MALSDDILVFSKETYGTYVETLRQNLNMFNEASGGIMVLDTKAVYGDWEAETFFPRIPGGLLRSRDPESTAVIPKRMFTMDEDVAVRVARGTMELDLNPSMLDWIGQPESTAAVVYGRQLAAETLADMVNTGIGVLVASISQVPALVYDATTATDVVQRKATWQNLTLAAGKQGDNSGSITGWIMHSTPMTNLNIGNLNNVNGLFNFGNVAVLRDQFGRPLVQTDSPQLVDLTVPATPVYNIIGGKPGAVRVSQNDDWRENTQVKNGTQNIEATWQAQWSYLVDVEGFAWDRAAGRAPNDAALLSSANWEPKRTSHKDYPAVLLKTL